MNVWVLNNMWNLDSSSLHTNSIFVRICEPRHFMNLPHWHTYEFTLLGLLDTQIWALLAYEFQDFPALKFWVFSCTQKSAPHRIENGWNEWEKEWHLGKKGKLQWLTWLLSQGNMGPYTPIQICTQPIIPLLHESTFPINPLTSIQWLVSKSKKVIVSLLRNVDSQYEWLGNRGFNLL